VQAVQAQEVLAVLAAVRDQAVVLAVLVMLVDIHQQKVLLAVPLVATQVLVVAVLPLLALEVHKMELHLLQLTAALVVLEAAVFHLGHLQPQQVLADHMQVVAEAVVSM
jgi:hypothetical protein